MTVGMDTLRASLADRYRAEPVAEAVRIAREVAGALDYAHGRGVIHRDIKPENIRLHDGQALDDVPDAFELVLVRNGLRPSR